MRRCHWCAADLPPKQQRYCGEHCKEQWRSRMSAASPSGEQNDHWLRAHIMAMAEAELLSDEPDIKTLIQARRELRQPYRRDPGPAAAEAEAADPLAVFDT